MIRLPAFIRNYKSKAKLREEIAYLKGRQFHAGIVAVERDLVKVRAVARLDPRCAVPVEHLKHDLASRLAYDLAPLIAYDVVDSATDGPDVKLFLGTLTVAAADRR